MSVVTTTLPGGQHVQIYASGTGSSWTASPGTWGINTTKAFQGTISATVTFSNTLTTITDTFSRVGDSLHRSIMAMMGDSPGEWAVACPSDETHIVSHLSRRCARRVARYADSHPGASCAGHGYHRVFRRVEDA